jgi:hypothetical protein
MRVCAPALVTDEAMIASESRLGSNARVRNIGRLGIGLKRKIRGTGDNAFVTDDS